MNIVIKIKLTTIYFAKQTEYININLVKVTKLLINNI